MNIVAADTSVLWPDKYEMIKKLHLPETNGIKTPPFPSSGTLSNTTERR